MGNTSNMEKKQNQGHLVSHFLICIFLLFSVILIRMKDKTTKSREAKQKAEYEEYIKTDEYKEIEKEMWDMIEKEKRENDEK